MTVLETQDKYRVRYHLAYTEAVPDGDRALLEDRMDNLDSPFYVNRIKARLDRCDRSLEESETDAQSSGVTNKRILLGDVNRTDLEYRAESWDKRKKAYVYETDQLALELGVPNYRNPEFWGNNTLHMGGRIPRIPAPTAVSLDLTIGSDIYLYYA